MSTPIRFGRWKQTNPFSLNNDFYADPFIVTRFQTPFNEVVPVISEFNINGSDPSGSRHLTNHNSFVKTLASGRGIASLNFESLDFQATDISTGSGVSKTKVFIFRVNKFTSPGITTVRNMKIWASDMTDFLSPETSKILYQTSNIWLSGFAFNASGIGNKSLWMPNSLPDKQNLFRQDSALTIHGSGDSDVSQYVYVALAASGTTPLGEYGRTRDGAEGFKIRVTYNVDNINRFQD